jgi:hypothetical protein
MTVTAINKHTFRAKPGILPVPELESRKERVLEIHALAALERRGVTYEELENATGRSNIISHRRNLANEGWLVDIGDVVPGRPLPASGRYKLARKGNPTVVWYLSEAGAKQFGIRGYHLTILGPPRPRPRYKSKAGKKRPHRRTTPVVNSGNYELTAADILNEWRLRLEVTAREFSRIDIPDPRQLAADLNDHPASYFTSFDLLRASKWLREFALVWSKQREEQLKED